MKALVVGGGFAGVAAAWALERRGREVWLSWDGSGASSLYSGALDHDDGDGAADATAVAREVEEFLHALGCWAPPGMVSARLASSAGVLRPARCRDRALLDLEPLRGRRIEVVDLARPGWDAAELARAFSASRWARQSRTEFRAVRVALPEAEAMRFLPDGELAARVDDPAWAAAFGEALRGAGDGEAPLLCGPWLGRLCASVDRVREVAKRPLGETLSEPGGPAGWRFEAARDAWLERSGVRVLPGRVLSIDRGADGFDVAGCPGNGLSLEPQPWPSGFTELILAVGGVAGGGIRFLHGPEARSFSLSVLAPLVLRLGGREVTLESSVLGVDLQSLGRQALEQVGVLVDEEQRTECPDLFAAGDVVADRPRAGLEAIYAGISAARAACRVRASMSP